MGSEIRKKYTYEFKVEAVKLLTEQGYTLAEAGRNLGINPSVLGKWKKYFADSTHGDVGSVGSPESLQAENRRLKEEIRRLKMEREILKKATAFFAKESQ